MNIQNLCFPIQNNIGIGLTSKEFRDGVAKGKLPVHIGLSESMHMLAHALHWKIDKIVETKVPVVAKKAIKVPGYKAVPAGKVAGFDQIAVGYSKGKEKIILGELGRVDPKLDYRNTIYIYGYPNIVETMNVPSGDLTTTSHAVNLIPVVVNARPGLLNMLDLPVAAALKDRE